MNTLLLGVVGSNAYGLAHADSDVDRLGVFAAPAVAFHGLRLPIDRAATVVEHDPDVTMHEARKLAMLCLSSNPTATELLWLPSYEVGSPLGEELVGIRGAFASADGVRNAYFGYATSQFKRLLTTGQFQSKMRSRRSKHARHLLRLLDQGYEYYATGRLTLRLADPERYREFGERVAADPSVARAALAAAEERFAATRSPLPAEPDTPVVEAWLLRVREAYR
ncbi:DNA polymerase beta superfamily protein [Cryptosporangium phraense]|uniref:Nucleotidyltransferase n=1 Tax=Cryptosporangium phraense TaxID=2593070 RepID=A0A545AKR6_9ACTN|nr:nucleotidyltransferase domain-containing protein [Cryptosporangium phraense]TQS41912.1 nucleotidyltransferase [Cryptosporangium phraense]